MEPAPNLQFQKACKKDPLLARITFNIQILCTPSGPAFAEQINKLIAIFRAIYLAAGTQIPLRHFEESGLRFSCPLVDMQWGVKPFLDRREIVSILCRGEKMDVLHIDPWPPLSAA